MKPESRPSNNEFLPQQAAEWQERLEKLLGTQQNPFDAIQNLITGHNKLRAALVEAKAQIEAMKEEIKKLSAPPLPYGIYEGLSKLENYVTIKVEGKKYDVMVANKNLRLEDLNRGQELLLNGAFNVLDVYGYEERGELSRVFDVLKDGRLIIRYRENEERVVHRAQPLVNEVIKVGDYVRFDPKSQLVIEVLPRREVEDVLLENIPDTQYSDIGGLDKQVEQIRDAIELPYLHKELYKSYQLRPPKGVLLYGAPGCGKTLIAKAVAHSLAQKVRKDLEEKQEAIELYQTLLAENTPSSWWERFWSLVEKIHPAQNVASTFLASPGQNPSSSPPAQRSAACQWLEAYFSERGINSQLLSVELIKVQNLLQNGVTGHFINIKGPELLNKYVGETERKIREIFLRAKEKAPAGLPVIIFFDEMESMFKTRGSGISSDIDSTIVPQLLAEIDGVEGLDNVIIIGASNRQDLIDPAVLRPGRLDIKIKIDRPDQAAASDIFTKYLVPSLPLHVEMLQENESGERAMQRMIDATVEEIYAEKEANRCLQIIYVDGEEKILYRKDFISGAMIAGIVSRAKKTAIKRYLATGAPGIKLRDLFTAIHEEYKENEDLPNTNDPEDWVKILGGTPKKIREVRPLFPFPAKEKLVEHP